MSARRIVLALFASLTIVACGSEAEPDTTSASSSTISVEPIEASIREQQLIVGPETVECEGEGSQTCLLVRTDENAEWEYFSGEIVGFTHRPGVTSTLLVEVITIADPPADGSSEMYELLEVLDESE